MCDLAGVVLISNEARLTELALEQKARLAKTKVGSKLELKVQSHLMLSCQVAPRNKGRLGQEDKLEMQMIEV